MGRAVYKRGKATPIVGASHGSDLAEFYGFGTEPDFIGTDALSECFPDLWASSLITLESTLQIPSTRIPRILKACYLRLIGLAGGRQPLPLHCSPSLIQPLPSTLLLITSESKRLIC